jgi:hypothetical protein
MTEPLILLQPKQGQAYDLVEHGSATWIGIGGGRGGAKSGLIQRIMLARRLERPGTIGVIVMRNSDQVRRYHEDVMLRTWPQMEDYYHKTERKIVLPMAEGPPSEIHFTYAESLADVIRRFRSANYFDIFIDQAEQFSEQELREIKQAVRWPNVPEGTCKLLLAFNMGGVGIDFLRKKFHLHEFNEKERREDFAFIHVSPFDNVEWSRPALAADGLKLADYYLWPEQKRREYCATRSDYGRALVSQDPAMVKRDWDGDWESLEGAFFGRVFDRDATVLSLDQVKGLIKPWWKRWCSQDWGRGHYCVTYWHARGEISPEEAKEVLGWDIKRTVKIVVTYREYIAGGAAKGDEGGDRELAEQDIALQIVQRSSESGRMVDGTQWEEKKQIKSFHLSPDAFAKRTSKKTIAQEYAEIFTKAGLPAPSRADDDVPGGWALMYNMLLAAKRARAGQLRTGEVWCISANCPELVSSIPLLMRDPKDLDRVHKTDKGEAKIEMDCSEAARYGLKSMLNPGRKPDQVEVEEKIAKMRESGLDENSLFIHKQRLSQELKKKQQPIQIGRRHGLVGRIPGL